MGQERRKSSRVGLRVPIRVQGRDAEGAHTWEEMTNTEEASVGGVSFHLKHDVRIGHVLHLSLPFPKRLRRYDLHDPAYRIYALVRNVRPEGSPPRIGVMFLGRQPPRGTEALPAGVFLMPGDPQPEERRRFPRVTARLTIKLQVGFGRAGLPEEEQTVAEDIGKFGAQVQTSLPVGKGDIVTVEELGGDFRTRAEIRNVSIGADGHPRLNLLFLDGPTPEHLLTTAPATEGSAPER